MFDVLKPEAVEFCHMVVVERIKDLPPILAGADQPQLAQSAQLMRDRGLGHFKFRGDLSHVHFPIE